MKMKRLKEKRELLMKELDTMVDSLEKDGEIRSFSKEESEAFDSKKAEIVAIDETIARIEENRAKDMGEEAVETLKEVREKDAIEERALENFLRGQDLEGEERTILASANTALIPLTISKTVLKKLEEQCPILEKAQRFSSKGTLRLIKETSYGEAGMTPENTQFGASDVTWGTVELKSFKITSLVNATFEMLANSEIDLSGYLLEVLTRRMSREINKKFLIGNGTNEPQGILSEGVEVQLNTDALTVNDFITMQTAVNPQYLNNANWIVGREVFTKMANLLDGNGRPYLISNYDAVNNKIQYSFLGLPVIVDNFMPEYSSGNKAVAMVNIPEAYSINVLQNITIKHMTEIGFSQGYESFASYALMDGRITNPEAIVVGKVK